MNYFHVRQIIIFLSICLFISGEPAFPVADANESLTEDKTEIDWVKIALDSGIEPERILGLDDQGIPAVCGTGRAESTDALVSLDTNALPSNTRGWEVIPNVIRTDGVDTCRIEVNTNGPVDRVYINCRMYSGDPLVPPGNPIVEFRDDGLGEDRIAGDYIYTSGLYRYRTDCSICNDRYKNKPDSPVGVDVTYPGPITIVKDGVESTGFLNYPKIGLLRSDIPDIPYCTLASNIVITPHLVNISSSNQYTQRLLRFYDSTTKIASLTNQIYGVLPDLYDFFMFFSTYKIESLPFTTSVNFNVGLHVLAQVNYTGTGKNVLNNAGIYGSEGRLLGLNVIDAYDRGIWGTYATHEILHQWGAYISSSFGLKIDSSHYYMWSSVASLLGGVRWIDNGDGTYTLDCNESGNGAHYASPFDKYLMGLIGANQVPTLYLYDITSTGPSQRCYYNIPVLESEITEVVTIDDVISVHGIRTPGPETSQKDYSILFVAESNERLLTPAELTFYEIFAEHYTKKLAPEDPDPFVSTGWQSIDRFFGEGSTWSSQIYPGPHQGNFNDDQTVDVDDLFIFIDAWMTEPGNPYWNPVCDISLTDDDKIDLDDFEILTRNWQKEIGP